MDKYEMNEIIMKQLCKEIEQIAESVRKTGQLSNQDLERLDKMYHTKKDILTAAAMEEADEYEQHGMSGYRGRAMNGRYVSRDAMNGSYVDGYSHGYSEAMSQMTRMNSGNNGNEGNNGNSGHYPMGYYPPANRW